MKRNITTWILAAILLCVMHGRAAAASPAVDWSLDHAAKKVDVRVRVAFWVDDTTQSVPTAQQVATTLAAMKRAWEGQPFLCYQLRVTIDAKVVVDPRKVPPDFVGVRLINIASTGPDSVTRQLHSVPYTRSYIASNNDEKARYFGDDEVDATFPDVGPPSTQLIGEKRERLLGILDQSRLWTNDPRPMTLSHEFGHIIGLHDSYGPGGGLRPYMVPDLMLNSGSTGPGKLWPESITKVVRRGGIKPTELKCSRHVRSTPIDLKLVPNLYGDLRLNGMVVDAENCEWLPLTVDPKDDAKKNVWVGHLRYQPGYSSPDQVHGFDIKTKMSSSGSGVVVEDVKFETHPYQHRTPGQEEAWETKDLFKDVNLEVEAMFSPQENGEVKGKDLTLKASYRKGASSIMAFEHGLPIEVTIEDGCK